MWRNLPVQKAWVEHFEHMVVANLRRTVIDVPCHLGIKGHGLNNSLLQISNEKKNCEIFVRYMGYRSKEWICAFGRHRLSTFPLALEP
jgi:hypothetical protein